MKTLKTLVLEDRDGDRREAGHPGRSHRSGARRRTRLSDGQPVPGAIPNAPQSGTRTGPVTAGVVRDAYRECDACERRRRAPGQFGRMSTPGASAVRFASCNASRFTGWQRTTRTAATGRNRVAVTSRTHVPGDLRHHDRLGSDCQSPDRLGDKRMTAAGSVRSIAAAGK